MRIAALGFMAILAFASPALAQGLKAPLLGLLDKGPASFYNFGETGNSPYPEGFNPTEVSVVDATGVSQPLPFAGVVLNVTWDQLEHIQNVYDFSFITTYFAAIDAYNASFATVPGFTPLRVKLRVWAGFVAPPWALNLDKGPMNINQSPLFVTSPEKGPIGLWWAADYINAWRVLQQNLAAQFDADPHIAEVAVSSCMHNTDEPFVTWLDTGTLNIMFGHGYTDALESGCITNALGDYQYWKQTPLDFTFNTYLTIGKKPLGLGYSVKTNDALTQSVMGSCRGQDCALDNHALQSPIGQSSKFVYSNIAKYPNSPAEFQMQSPSATNNLCDGISLGVQSYHARSVEIWPDFGGYLSWPATGARSQQTCTAALSVSILNGGEVDATQCPTVACPSP